MSDEKLWPDKLEWRFIDPDSSTRDDTGAAAEEAKDAGFYDAEFGSLVLRVIVRLDGRFQAAFGNDYVEITDEALYGTLEEAHSAACYLGGRILIDGLVRLMEHRRVPKANGGWNVFGGAEFLDFAPQMRPGDLVTAKLVDGKLDSIDPVDIADCVVLQSILGLADRDVPIEVIEKWTPEERKAAQDWAGAVHLSASDNDDVVVPPEPEHVKASAKRVELNWP